MVKSVRLPYGWTLSDSLALTELHDDVDWFASEYSATLLGPFPDEVKQICEPLRRREMDRVRSAFFRFELYRRLHLKCRLYEDYPDANDNKEVFPKMFAPWENEQLVTIYEYLLQRLSIAFNDVAEHDILWGKHQIRYNPDEDAPFRNTFKEHCLSLGLAWIRRLSTAKGYDQRYQLLAPETGEQHADFMFKVFCNMDVFRPYKQHQTMIHWLTDENCYDYIPPPLVEDENTGPVNAWAWAHNSFSIAYTYGQRELARLRKSGYVMFDLDRLQNRYDLETPLWLVLRDYSTCYYDYSRSYAKMEDTIRKRSEIYDAGGRGYWNEETGSELVWNIPCPDDTAALTLEGESYRDSWYKGILVDRVRADCYRVIDRWGRRLTLQMGPAPQWYRTSNGA